MENKKEIQVTILLALIERFEDLEKETGADFTYAKRIILRFGKKHDILEN